jgi:HK97 family phage prohead protease
MYALTTLKQFREQRFSEERGHGIELMKRVAATIKADQAARTLEIVISTAAVDREGDTIAVDGWRIDNYLKNPVVLWGHDRWSPPIARSTSVRIEQDKLIALAEFPAAGVYPFADTIFTMATAGFINASSVGFRPIKWAWVEDVGRPYGIDFIEQELLEWSLVTVPANPEALVQAAKAAKGGLLPELLGEAHSSASRQGAPEQRGIALTDLAIRLAEVA